MDRDIADRMRSENFEQFQTLVRMHLSFELDLNTDAVEYVSLCLLLKLALCEKFSNDKIKLFLV